MTVPAEQPQSSSGEISFDEDSMVFEALSLLDRSRENYLGCCTRYSEWPTLQNEEFVRQATHVHSTVFVNVLDVLAVDTPTVSFVYDGVAALRQENDKRADTLNGLLRSDRIGKLTVDLEGMPEYVFSLTEPEGHARFRKQARNQIIDDFNKTLTLDTKKFVAETQTTRLAQRIRKQEAFRKHAVDVLKMTLSVAGAILLTRDPRRPKS